MSAPRKPAARESEQRERADWFDSNLELIQAIGGSEYDPLAPDQYLFRLDPAMKLSHVAHQLHTWVLWLMIHLKKPGGRTPYAAWGGRAVGLQDAKQDLKRDMPAISKAWRELGEKGLCRKDDEGRLVACARVKYRMPAHAKPKAKNQAGEETVKLFVQTTNSLLAQFPKYVKKRVEALPEEDRDAFFELQKRIDAAEDQAIAAVTAQVREKFAPIRKAHLATVGVKQVKLKKGKPKKAIAEPDLQVELQLKLPDFGLFVQTTEEDGQSEFAQTRNSSSHKPNSGDAQTTHLYEKGQRDKAFSSSSETEQPNATTTSNQAINQIHAAYRDYDKLADRKLAVQTWLLATRLDPVIQPDEVLELIHRYAPRRKESFGYVLTCMSNALPLTRSSKQQPSRENEVRSDDPALTRWRKEQEAALDDPAVSEQEKHLIRICLGLNSEPGEKAKGAGAS